MAKKKQSNDAWRTIAVLGLGTFGARMARVLYEGGAEVLAIDRQEDRVERAAQYATQALCGDATREDVLTSTGVLEANVAVVAMKSSFDATVLVTHRLARAKVEQIVVQVDSDQQAEAIQVLGATHVVFPERDLAERTARGILTPGLADYIPLTRKVSIVELPVQDELKGKTLIDLNFRQKYGVSVVAIDVDVDGRREILVEDLHEHVLREGDRLLVLGKTERLDRLREKTYKQRNHDDGNNGNEKE